MGNALAEVPPLQSGFYLFADPARALGKIPAGGERVGAGPAALTVPDRTHSLCLVATKTHQECRCSFSKALLELGVCLS